MQTPAFPLLPSIVITTLSCLMGSHAAAQGAAPIVAGQFGFFAADSAGGAGTRCSGFSCTPAKMTTSVNATVTLTVRAPRNAWYVILVGPRTNLCLDFPGFLNKWVVPPTVVLPGVVNQAEPPFSLRCFGWQSRFSATIPASARSLDPSQRTVRLSDSMERSGHPN